jgi:hypothetical protein
LRKKTTAIWLMLFIITAATISGAVQAQTIPGNTLYLPAVMVQPSPTPRPSATPITYPTLPPPTLTNIIDHTTLPLYDQIPSQYLNAAEQIRFTFIDRSVGANINDGLTCLAAANWGASASTCRRAYLDSSLTDWKTFTTSDNSIPPEIRFPGGNDRSNLNFVYREGTWEDDLNYFINSYPSMVSSTDIYTLQHNYLHVASGSTIANVYFDPNYSGANIYDLEALEARYPNRTFVYWTTSLARTVGTAEAQSFNDQMRAWARANNKILIDVAAILSHTPSGAPCRNAQGYEIICQDYTTETEGGHLGSVSAGKLRVAKAIWILLAQLGGWHG